MPTTTAYKNLVHQELRIRHKEFFESKLAIHALKQGQRFDSVALVSKSILQLIETNPQKVIQIMESNPRIISDLREPFFGACFTADEEVSALNCFNKITGILRNDSADLKHVMQIHGVFVYRLLDALKSCANKKDYVGVLFPHSLFHERSREVKPALPTHCLGISKHPVYKKMLEKSNQKHLRGMDQNSLKADSLFFKAATEKSIPTVCGPSGHTGSFLLGALCYGNLSQEQLKEYSFIIFSFLAAGGHHSYHEVMLVANCIGVEYQPGEYEIPLTVKQTEGYEQLNRQFSLR